MGDSLLRWGSAESARPYSFARGTLIAIALNRYVVFEATSLPEKM